MCFAVSTSPLQSRHTLGVGSAPYEDGVKRAVTNKEAHEGPQVRPS